MSKLELKSLLLQLSHKLAETSPEEMIMDENKSNESNGLIDLIAKKSYFKPRVGRSWLDGEQIEKKSFLKPRVGRSWMQNEHMEKKSFLKPRVG